MPYYREPLNYNPGCPSRSTSPPQFPEYSLWGDSSSSPNLFHKAPQRPPQRADEGSRPYYQSPDDYPKSSRNQRGDRCAWPPQCEEGSMSFRNFSPRRPDEYTRSPNQFTEDLSMRVKSQSWHNASQYDEQRFSVSPQTTDEYCRSPFQPAMQYSENPQLPMSMRMQHSRFRSPTERSDGYCRSPFQTLQQYSYNEDQFLIPEPPQRQLPYQRDDETRAYFPFPAYNSFMKYTGHQQSSISRQGQSYRLRSPLHKPDLTWAEFSESELQFNHSNDFDEDNPLPMPQTQLYRFRSPLPRTDMQNSQSLPSKQQNNFMDYAEDPLHTMPSESQLQINTQFAEDIPKVSAPPTEAQEPDLKKAQSESPENIIREEKSQPEETEERESDIVVIERKSLYLHPDNFQFDDEFDITSLEPQEQASTSIGSAEWTSGNFKREGAPSRSSIQPSRVQGQKTNTLNKRLVKALSQPVKMDKGAKMMQRMGWIGGGLGKDGTGIVDPIAPNAIYATTTVGFGQEVRAIQRLPTKRENRSPCIKKIKNKKMHNDSFKTNVLLYVLKFATNDLQVELYFEAILKNHERKRIHRIIEAIGDEDTNMHFGEQIRILEDIRRRCRFILSTQSDGEGEERKICVFKEAPEHMFLVTPDDCRPCLSDDSVDEEEPNPFLKSIKKHIKEDRGTASPASSSLLDKLVKLFIEFCESDAYTEFRFLGPFTKKELTVMNCFFTLIEDLSRHSKPQYEVPVELLDVFDGDYLYHTEMDPNGFTSIKKMHISMKEEYEKLIAEEREKRFSLRLVNHWPERFAWRTKETTNDDGITQSVSYLL